MGLGFIFPRWVSSVFCLLVMLALADNRVVAQERPLLRLFITPDVDTNYIDLQRDKWSVRAFSTFKFHSLILGDGNGRPRLQYRSDSHLGVGVGLAYRYLLIDLGIGLDFTGNEETSEFDLQTNLMLAQRHLFDLTLQLYKGYELVSAEDYFRNDIRTLFSGVNYSNYLNSRQLSMRSVFRGDFLQKKTAWSPILGGYAFYQRLRADSSLLAPVEPDDNPYAHLRESDLFSFGISGGAATTLVLPRHFFFYAGLLPAIGFEVGKMRTAELTYSPRLFPGAKVNLRSALGYAHPRFYVLLSAAFDQVFPNLGNHVDYRYRLGKLKLLFGWRFGSEVDLLERINRAFEQQVP